MQMGPTVWETIIQPVCFRLRPLPTPTQGISMDFNTPETTLMDFNRINIQYIQYTWTVFQFSDFNGF